MDNLNKLLCLSAKKDIKAFKQLYMLTSPRLYQMAFIIVQDQHLADKVVEKTYVKVWTQAGRYHATTNKRALSWLSHITQRIALGISDKDT